MCTLGAVSSYLRIGPLSQGEGCLEVVLVTGGMTFLRLRSRKCAKELEFVARHSLLHPTRSSARP